MSFLQINNPDGTSGIKRPFRLSDIQDIWEGIKSLFKAIAGQQFRIISGFDLMNGVYTSGTVWFNGELYEYDSNAYPITPSTTRVSFARAAQDNRVWEDGDTLPFSYKYVCGGDALSGSVAFSYFVANIEKYKSYLGNGSVSTEKLANESVTMEKLSSELFERVPMQTIAVTSNDPIDLAMLSDGAIIIAQTGCTKLQFTNTAASLPATVVRSIPVVLLNQTQTAIPLSDIDGGVEAYSESLPVGSGRATRFVPVGQPWEGKYQYVLEGVKLNASALS